jgi:Homeodomain-like domain
MPESAHKSNVDKAEIYRLIDTGLSQGAVSRQTGISQPTISRWLKERRDAAGAPEQTNGLPAVYQGERGVTPDGIPDSIPGIPVSPNSLPEAQWREAIESRLDVIESFIAAAQQRAHGIPVIPESIPVTPESIPVTPESIPGIPLTTGTPPPTKKHSFVIAVDLLDQINAYADTHHLEIKTVLDLALRRFFAGEGGDHG